MAIKLSPADAVASAIASVRMEGLPISPAHRATLDKMANGQLSAAQARRAILDTVKRSQQPGSLAGKKAATGKP